MIRQSKKDILWITLTIVCIYVIAGILSFYFSFENSIVTITIFFPEGIALGLVLLYGRKVIPGIFLGQFFLALYMKLDIYPSFFIALSNSLEAVLAIYIFKKYKFDNRLLYSKDIYFLFFVITIILQPFSAVLGTIVLMSFSILKISFAYTIFSWWFGNIMGQLLLVPMLLILYENRKEITVRNTLWIIILFVVINYYFIIVLKIDNIALLFSIMVPTIILVARYIGLHYASIGILVITISSLYMLRIGIGIFSTDTILNNLININFYILAHILIVYIHGILMLEKELITNKLVLFNKQLEKNIQREININREKERLLIHQSRMAQVGEMIAIIAHQWKQPLNTLSLIASRVYRQHSINDLSKQEMKDFYGNSQIQIQEMVNIVNTFSNFFEPSSVKEEYKIDESIANILNILDPVFKEESIIIHLKIEKNITITGSKNEFSQVILNILNNAKDAFITMNTSVDRQIWIEGKINKNKIQITIEDNAGGIPHDILAQIFNAYFTTKTNAEGSGLGLYLSKIIIETYMNGSITAQNTKKGTKFDIIV